MARAAREWNQIGIRAFPHRIAQPYGSVKPNDGTGRDSSCHGAWPLDGCPRRAKDRTMATPGESRRSALDGLRQYRLVLTNKLPVLRERLLELANSLTGKLPAFRERLLNWF